MSSEIEKIVLSRYEDEITIFFYRRADDKYEFITYRTGELESEDDVESSYIGALKHFFNESEVWNG